jgi:uncharacterized protein (DUF58 family)
MSELFDDDFLVRIERLFLVSKKMASGSAQAFRRSKKLGAGLEVADFRPYVDGDNLRDVDWNYYASTRELIVRLFEEEEDLHIYLLVDVSSSMRIGDGQKFDYARRLTAALAYIGLSNLDRVSVVPFADDTTGYLPPSRGRGQIWKVFKFLDQAFTGGRTNTENAFRRFVAQTRRRGLVVVVSDFYDPSGFVEGLNYLRFHRFEPMVLHVYDEDDRSPALSGDLDMVDCETGERVAVTVTPSLLAAYREAHDSMMAELSEFCRTKNVLYLRTPIQQPFDELVLRIFRLGGFLR